MFVNYEWQNKESARYRAHHKDWVIDQMVRVLTGCNDNYDSDEYIQLINDACSGKDGLNTYYWEVGVPP